LPLGKPSSYIADWSCCWFVYELD